MIKKQYISLLLRFSLSPSLSPSGFFVCLIQCLSAKLCQLFLGKNSFYGFSCKWRVGACYRCLSVFPWFFFSFLEAESLFGYVWNVVKLVRFFFFWIQWLRSGLRSSRRPGSSVWYQGAISVSDLFLAFLGLLFRGLRFYMPALSVLDQSVWPFWACSYLDFFGGSPI